MRLHAQNAAAPPDVSVGHPRRACLKVGEARTDGGAEARPPQAPADDHRVVPAPPHVCWPVVQRLGQAAQGQRPGDSIPCAELQVLLRAHTCGTHTYETGKTLSCTLIWSPPLLSPLEHYSTLPRLKASPPDPRPHRRLRTCTYTCTRTRTLPPPLTSTRPLTFALARIRTRTRTQPHLHPSVPSPAPMPLPSPLPVPSPMLVHPSLTLTCTRVLCKLARVPAPGSMAPVCSHAAPSRVAGAGAYSPSEGRLRFKRFEPESGNSRAGKTCEATQRRRRGRRRRGHSGPEAGGG